MKNIIFRKYHLLSLVGVMLASYYPLSMGISVVTDMINNGTVLKEDYPKYIIPYTPICLAILIGVIVMPLCIKFFKKFALLGGSALATGSFFAIEMLFEKEVVVTTSKTITKLQDWQMFMCVYTDPEIITTYKRETPVDILIGNYNPTFKLHFYIISVILIITILDCLYGFGQIIKNKDKTRLKSLILQGICSLVFLGLCILACFTAFSRDGNIQVSPVSAVLMALFFIILGITAGVFVGSFLLVKRKFVSLFIPAIVASVMTFTMYIGEMILLKGHLYRLGTGLIFNPIPVIVLSHVDILIVLASGFITALILLLQNKNTKAKR